MAAPETTLYLALSLLLAAVMGQGLPLVETVALVVGLVQNLALTHLAQAAREIRLS
jgi:hypothetical protein